MTKLFYFSTLSQIILLVLLSIFFIPIFSNLYQSSTISFKTYNHITSFKYDSSAKDSIKLSILWPTPGYSKITSKFGYRTAPTNGAGTYHGGIDIAAPEGSSIISFADGIVSFTGWNGANGYTVIITHSNNIKSIYGHVSPNFLVAVGDNVKKGQLIAKIGSKYVTKTNQTTYTDKTGKYTNGATTGPHLHFSISKNGKKIDPEGLF